MRFGLCQVVFFRHLMGPITHAAFFILRQCFFVPAGHPIFTLTLMFAFAIGLASCRVSFPFRNTPILTV